MSAWLIASSSRACWTPRLFWTVEAMACWSVRTTSRGRAPSRSGPTSRPMPASSDWGPMASSCSRREASSARSGSDSRSDWASRGRPARLAFDASRASVASSERWSSASALLRRASWQPASANASPRATGSARIDRPGRAAAPDRTAMSDGPTSPDRPEVRPHSCEITGLTAGRIFPSISRSGILLTCCMEAHPHGCGAPPA